MMLGKALVTMMLSTALSYHTPRLVRFDPLQYASFGKLHYLPLPYGGLNKTWVMAASCCDTLFNRSAVRAASQHYGELLTPSLECCEGSGSTVGGGKMGEIGEWGYEFQAFDYRNFATSPCVNLTLPSLALKGTRPRGKLEALSLMNRYYDCRVAEATDAPGAAPTVMNMIGHYFYGGFGIQRGHTAVVASEIQENINSIQAHFALTRGAARQNRLAWAIDVSPWMSGYITDYSETRPWENASSAGGNGGHSLSLFKRSWYLSYLSGASHLIIEAGGVNLFLENSTLSGVLPLSPLGKQAATLSTFIASISERAIPYVPVAVVLEHAHGFGLGLLRNPQPLTWNSFPLTGSDQVAWSLLQALWPASWRVQSQGAASESNYLVASPYGDSFDVLSEYNFSDALDLYRVLVTAGNVSLGKSELAALGAFAADGGTVVVFASQLAADGEALIGARLGKLQIQPKIDAVRDLETGWKNNSKYNGTTPFCVAQSVDLHSSWYIKTGGDTTTQPGWGTQDKCCMVGPSNCGWYSTKQLCEAALQSVSCQACLPGEVSIGCPCWQEDPLPQHPLGLRIAQPTVASVLLDAMLSSGKSPVPIALKNSVGKGVVLTVLLEDMSLLERFGILEHILSRLATDVLPFELVDPNGTDMLTQLEMALSRTSTGWQVTIVNNNGVTKQPAAAAVVDNSWRLSTIVRLKQRYGTATSAMLLTDGGSSLPVVNNSVQVMVEAGDLAVVQVMVQPVPV